MGTAKYLEELLDRALANYELVEDRDRTEMERRQRNEALSRIAEALRQDIAESVEVVKELEREGRQPALELVGSQRAVRRLTMRVEELSRELKQERLNSRGVRTLAAKMYARLHPSDRKQLADTIRELDDAELRERLDQEVRGALFRSGTPAARLEAEVKEARQRAHDARQRTAKANAALSTERRRSAGLEKELEGQKLRAHELAIKVRRREDAKNKVARGRREPSAPVIPSTRPPSRGQVSEDILHALRRDHPQEDFSLGVEDNGRRIVIQHQSPSGAVQRWIVSTDRSLLMQIETWIRNKRPSGMPAPITSEPRKKEVPTGGTKRAKRRRKRRGRGGAR